MAVCSTGSGTGSSGMERLAARTEGAAVLGRAWPSSPSGGRQGQAGQGRGGEESSFSMATMQAR